MGNKNSTESVLAGKNAGVWKIDRPITGYKKIRCQCQNGYDNNNYKFIARVSVPIGAHVVRSLHNRGLVSDKIRTDEFKIEEINAIPNFSGYEKCIPIKCHSIQDRAFDYEAGKTYHPDLLDKRTRFDCTHGLYFFLTETEAINY